MNTRLFDCFYDNYQTGRCQYFNRLTLGCDTECKLNSDGVKDSNCKCPENVEIVELEATNLKKKEPNVQGMEKSLQLPFLALVDGSTFATDSPASTTPTAQSHIWTDQGTTGDPDPLENKEEKYCSVTQRGVENLSLTKVSFLKLRKDQPA